jgi:hypothetical protein
MGLARSCALSAVSEVLAGGLERKANTVRHQLREFCYEAKANRGGPRHSNSRLRVKARKLRVGAPEFLRFAKL